MMKHEQHGTLQRFSFTKYIYKRALKLLTIMRRSLAPSQRSSFGSGGRPDQAKSSNLVSSSSSMTAETYDTIERMPMFGFLSIPNNLQRQFKIPSGCKITSKNIELRKVKSLGPKRTWQPLRPGDLSSFRTSTMDSNKEGGEEDGDADLEGLPNTESLPPFERLILWKDENDLSNFVEVVPELACKLRPHQREGVQFLFECTMGLRGFDGQGCILADDMGKLFSLLFTYKFCRVVFLYPLYMCRRAGQNPDEHYYDVDSAKPRFYKGRVGSQKSCRRMSYKPCWKLGK